MKNYKIVVLLSLLVLMCAIGLSAQTRERVRFTRGTHGANVRGTVRGYAYRDYVVGAVAGQTMDLRLTASNASTVITVFLPNGDNLDGASETTEFNGELPGKGDYVIRVLMMRSAARRKASVSNFTLAIGIR